MDLTYSKYLVRGLKNTTFLYCNKAVLPSAVMRSGLSPFKSMSNMLPNSEQTLMAGFINLLFLTVISCLTLNGFKGSLSALNLQTPKQLEGRRQNVKHFYKK